MGTASTTARIVLPYAALASLWILLSDTVVAFLALSGASQTAWSIGKGLTFILVTSGLLASLLSKELRVRASIEKSLRESERRLRVLGDNLPDSYLYQYALGPDGPEFLYVSAGAETIHGLTPEQITAHPEKLLKHLSPALRDEAVGKGAKSGQLLFGVEIVVRGPQGEEQWIQLRSRPRPLEGGRVIWDGLATNITARKQAEQEIARLNEKLRAHAADLERKVDDRTRELRIAKERAESADRMKSTFLAVMSHELRTPLNSILGFASILLKDVSGPTNPEQRKQLQIIRDNGQRLLLLINDVLDFSKIEAGKLEIRLEQHDLRDALSLALDTVTPMAQSKGLEVRCDLPETPVMAHCDPQRCAQILINLVGNAIKFTNEGFVRIGLRTSDGETRVFVEDSGPGISPEGMARLFRPFEQLDSQPTRSHEGTGLGLAISQRLAQMMGWKIEVQSVQGRGSIFSWVIPSSPARSA